MKRYILFLMMVASGSLVQAAPCSSVSQFGITFTFDQTECGQFINGDSWIVGPVTIRSITPAATNGMHGWMANVTQEYPQPFDFRNGNYTPALMPTLPYTAQPNTSIIKTVSVPYVNGTWSDCEARNKVCQESAAILTVVSAPPAADAFRPPYTGNASQKEYFYGRDLQTSMLRSLAPVANTPTQQDIEDRVDMPRLDHTNSSMSQGQYVPYNSVHPLGRTWGAEMAVDNAEVLFWLSLNQPLSQKLTTLYRFVQQGIDIYGARKFLNTGYTQGGGGNGAGRILPVVFAAAILRSNAIQSVLMTSVVNQPKNNTFWESDMYHVSRNNQTVLWGLDTGYGDPHVNYWNAVDHETYDRTAVDPYGFIDGIPTYQLITAMPTKYEALVWRLYQQQFDQYWPGGEPTFLRYADRWTNQGLWMQPDPCAPYDGNLNNYGITFGPNPSRPGECILDPDLVPGSTFANFTCQPGRQCGRFPDQHGRYPNGIGIGGADRRSDFGEAMWNAYRNLSAGNQPPSGGGGWTNGPRFDDPNYFPIAVWLQDPSNAQRYRNIGVNLFIGLWQGPTQNQLQVLDNANMDVIASQNSVGLNYGTGNPLVGWAQVDEPDNAQWNGTSYDPCISPTVIQNNYNQWKAADPTRPVFLNFGRGLSDENWVGRGTCTGNLNMYPEYMEGADILSFDIYPVNDIDPPSAGNPWYVARGVERLVQWNNQYFGGQKKVWNIIELSNIDSGDASALPTIAQVRAEVWMSIASGSKGIGYFVHEFNPFFEASILDRNEAPYVALRAGVTALNAEITSLAPVINSPTVTGLVNVTESNSAVPLRTMVKQFNGQIYIFAVAMRNGSTTGTFTFNGVSPTNVEVIGESRSITPNGNAFSDSFTGYGVHLYKISTEGGGSSTNSAVRARETTVVPCSNPRDPEERSSVPYCFDLKTDANVVVTIYSRNGKKVRELINGRKSAGENHVLWDLKDDSGNSVGSGSYTVIFESEGIRKKSKLGVIR